jgi:hypothetical protein
VCFHRPIRQFVDAYEQGAANFRTLCLLLGYFLFLLKQHAFRG